MSTSTLSPTSRMLTNLKKHPLYYHANMDLTVIVRFTPNHEVASTLIRIAKVADTCFRQASHFFTRESPVFRERLAEDTAKTDTPNHAKPKPKEADSDVCANHTIVIEPHENVSPEDFAELCSIFYNPKYSIYDKSLESWRTILRLANQWSFPEVKALAFRELDAPGKFSMSLVERIVLYQQYNAEKTYLEPLYEELLMRRDALTEREGEALGLKSALKISAARQELIRFMLPEAARTEPLPSKMKDVVLKVASRLLGSSSGPAPAPSDGKLHIDTQSMRGTASPGSTNNGGTGADDVKKKVTSGK